MQKYNVSTLSYVASHAQWEHQVVLDLSQSQFIIPYEYIIIVNSTHKCKQKKVSFVKDNVTRRTIMLVLYTILRCICHLLINIINSCLLNEIAIKVTICFLPIQKSFMFLFGLIITVSTYFHVYHYHLCPPTVLVVVS